jgi:TP901 family phage tail tape measure protein
MANKKLSATITIGGAVASSLASAFGTVKNQIGQVGSALRRAEREQRMLSDAIQTFGRMSKNVDGLRAKYAAVTAQIEKLTAAHKSLARIESARQANLSKRADYRGQMVDAVAIGATVASPMVQAAKFETAMLGVAKQVEGARDKNGKLTATYYEMGKAIQKMGREIPLATNDLADMVAAGARMGVAKDQLIDFTRTAAMMADAFELPAGELADNMGKIAGLFKIPIPAIGQLADSINYLDDNAISKGADIIDFLTRTGGVAASVKVTGKEMAALGSTLLTLGERTETAGTATNAMFSKLAAATKGTKKFRAAMKQVGLSTKAVEMGMQTDAIGTLMKVMDAVGKLPAEKRLGVLTDLVGLEHSDTLAKLATNTEEFRKQLAMANSEAAKGSMGREFAARLQTTNAQWQITKNRVNELAVNIGSVLLPALNETFSVIGPVVSKVADWARENPKVTQAIVGTAVALTSLKLATLAAGYAFTFVRGGALALASVLPRLQAQAALLPTRLGLMGLKLGEVAMGVRALGMALVTTPIGAIIAGIALGGLMIYRHWDGVAAFLGGVFAGIKEGLAPVGQAFSALWEALKPLHPIFDALGTALGMAWGWFTKLLEPVVYTSDELRKAGEAGKSFGTMLGEGITFALLPLTKLIEGITWVANNIGGVLDKVIAFKSATSDAVGGAWNKTKSFFGGGDISQPAAGNDTQAPASQGPTGAAGPQALPPVPAMATSRAVGSSYTDQSQTTIQVTQRPGENNADLARRIADEQERRKGIRQRGLMTDGVTAQ